MPKPKKETTFPATELLIVRSCLLVAFGIALFLAWNAFKGGGVPGCGPESDCDKVLTSRWAYVFGLPLSALALPAYTALLITSRPRRVEWSIVTPLAFILLLAALWFVGVQAFALRAFCKFCLAAHLAGAAAALILIKNAPVRIFQVGIAAAAVAGLAAIQSTAPDRAPARLVTGAPMPSEAVPNFPGAAVPSPVFQIMEGNFKLRLDSLPVTGPSAAPKKLAKLFDYTCHHCRDLHHLLNEFRRNYSNDVAIVSLPLPLDTECNPLVRKTPAAHQNACKYASLGLAVFHADPTKFEAFTDWVFTPPKPPDVEATRRYAANLVGSRPLEEALANPAIAEQIKLDIEIYKAAYVRTKSGQLPQLYFETGASIGAIETRERLEQVLTENGILPILK